MDMIKMVSILGAALSVSFGAIGPALGEGRARGAPVPPPDRLRQRWK